MAESSSGNSGGIGFIGALQLLFIGLKLGGVISWSWWLVMAPTLIWVLVVVLLLAFIFAMTVLTK